MRVYNDKVVVEFIETTNHRTRKMSFMRKIKPYCSSVKDRGNVVVLRRRDFKKKRNTTFAQLLTIYADKGVLEVLEGKN